MKRILFTLVITCCCLVQAKAQLTITPKTAAQAPSVVQNDFLGATGVWSVSNVTFRGGPQGLATYTGSSNNGIPTGIILTSGAAPNIAAAAGTQNDVDHNIHGDPDLQTLSVNTVMDVAVLEFDFVPLTDTIKFRYVFGSEEYPEYVCSQFNDVFGFFVSGPNPSGGNYVNQNIAVIPGTTLPVAIGSVNPGVPGTASGGGTCNLANQSLAYSAYYVANSGTTIIFDGFTVVMEAVIPVKMCADYHIKLAVGDASDGIFDSGVFLEANSFGGDFIHIYDTTGTQVGVDSTILCAGDTATLVAPNSISYGWPGGLSTQTIQVTSPGTYQCFVFNPVNGCLNLSYNYNVIGSNPIAEIDTNGIITLCAGDSVELICNSPGSYLWSNGETTQSIWIDFLEVGTYSVTLTDQWGACDDISDPVTVFSGTAAAVITPQSSTTFCQGGSVDLVANPGTTYLWSNGATTQTINVTTSGTFTVTVTSGSCAAMSLPTTVTVNNPVVAINNSGPLSFCQGGNVTLTASAGFNSYLWNNGSTTNSVVITTNGPVQVTATDTIGCQATANVNVTVNSTVASINTIADSVLCPNDSIQLVASAGSSYSWNTGATSSAIWVLSAGNYTVQVQDVNGCVDVSDPTPIYMSIPAAAITPANDTTICIGSVLNLTGSGGTSYQWSNGTLLATTNVATTNTYTVTVTNADGCKATAAIDVTVNDPQVTISTSDPLSFCSGSSATINALPGFANYLWSNGASGTNSITVTQTDTISVTVTDNAGCTDQSNVIYTQANSASVQVVANSDLTICPNENITLNAVPNNGINYTWSNGSSGPSIVVNDSGSYSVEITDLNGCIAQSNVITVIKSNPFAGVTSVNGAFVFCPDSSLNLVANPGVSTDIGYLWNNGALTQTINITAQGTYTVTVTNADTCSAVASLTVSEAQPIAQITPLSDTTFCKGSTVTLTANSGSSWTWSNGETDSVIVVSSAGIYNVNVNDQYGCPATDEVTVTVNEADAQISPSNGVTFCDGDSIQLSNNSANTVSLVWSNGLSSSSIWVNDDLPYYFILTDINGCTDTSTTVTNTVNVPEAKTDPSGQLTICENATDTIFANAGAFTASGYLWSTGATSPYIIVNGNGNYFVSVEVTNTFGCKEQSLPVDIITSIPTAEIVSPVADSVNICPNEQVILTANNGSQYLWSTNETGSQINVTSQGSFYVDVTNAYGCIARSQTVVVNQLYAFADLTVSGNTSFCEGDSVTLSVTTPGSYVWSNGATDPTITVSQSALYAVVVTNLNGCKEDTSVNVVAHEYPQVNFTADSSSECEAFKIRFRNYSTYDNGSAFAWDFGDGVTSNQQSPVHWYVNSGSYNVVLTINSPFGCNSTDSSLIIVERYPDPIASFKTNTSIENVFAGTIAFTNTSKNAVRYHWDFGDRSGSTEENPIHDYREPGYYKVKLTAFNPANCEHAEISEVTIAPLFIPSAFTPNADGKNDEFPGSMPLSLEIGSFEMKIWNRWGQPVFLTDNPYKGWNGKAENGDDAEQGLYIYQLKVTDLLNKDFSFNGTFTLVR